MTLLSVAAGTSLNYFFFDGTIGNVWGDGIREFLCQLGWKPVLSHIIGEFYMEFADKVVTLFTLFVIVKLWKRGRKKRRETRQNSAGQVTARALVLLFVSFSVFDLIPVQAAQKSTQASLAQVEDYNSYIQTVYDSGTGLPGGVANDIAQSKDGVLWIEGNLWFTSSRLGLLRLCKSVFSEISRNGAMEKTVVNSIVKWDNCLLVGTDTGLTKLDENGKTPVEDALTDALEGFDGSTKTMLQSELTDISYTNLPAGDYIFHLAVLNSKGKSTIAESSYKVIKEKEIYDHWWFLAYMIAVFALAIIYLTWLLFRTQVQKTLNMQKRELELTKNQVEMGNETILTIAKTVDAKDENTSQHSIRVSEYSVLIAQRLGFSEQACDELRRTALLHDIGKIAIPDSVLNKPARLTDEEYEIMKSHVVKGADILKNFTLLEHVEEGALYHHERYDGRGYVHGLKGEEIPLNARIIGIADAFDAMTANRVYRKKLDPEYVLGELKKGRGTQFDPKLADILLELIADGTINLTQLYESADGKKDTDAVKEQQNEK